ncbi:Spy/CpxP family protein refolding chaperone [Propionivibrio dicarboxylicus]|uniref:Heavy-metal resistance n=1 Tax=Propionivibrio dicarboxylicus TaxID=83767 RepID=A0A1G7VPM0_9RHOO|nr:periplasmic heavy metal sensor [Propionivibrio dicarboxylicus]SDG61713.1 Heavy-metal resistance [Propionivibrio dicarboxylicus]
MKIHKHSPRFLIAALTLSLGVAAGAFAMPRGEAGSPGMQMHGMHAGFAHGGRAMQRLHDDLKLDAAQEAAWQDAEKFAKDSFANGRDAFRKQHEEIQAALAQPGADLRAIVKRMDDLKAEGQKQRTAVRDRWLAVYDKLNPEQKEKARLFFKAGAERMTRGRTASEWHHRPQRGGLPGDARPAPDNVSPRAN